MDKMSYEEYVARVPLKRVAAGVLIRDRANPARMLLVEPTYKPGWEIPGGMVERDESPWAGASRELHEELSLTVPLGRMLVLDYVDRSGLLPGDGIMFIFDGGLLDEARLAELVFADGEIRSAGFHTRAEMWQKMPQHLAARVNAAMDAVEQGSTILCEQAGHSADHVGEAARSNRSRPISATFFISSAFTQPTVCATVLSGLSGHGNGAWAARSASPSRSTMDSQSTRSPRSHSIVVGPSPGQVTSSRGRGARPLAWSAAVVHHQPRCQVS